MTRRIDLIVVHCSATPNGKPFTAADIDAWHYRRGFRRTLANRQRQEMNLQSIGYHWVIYVNGAVANGRHLDEVGAHAQGHNTSSIGICMIGTDRFTVAQWDSLRDNLCATARTLAEASNLPDRPRYRPTPSEALALYRRMGVRVVGHRDLSPDVNGDGTIEPSEWIKTCPGFDVAAWLTSPGLAPLSGHLIDATHTPEVAP